MRFPMHGGVRDFLTWVREFSSIGDYGIFRPRDRKSVCNVNLPCHKLVCLNIGNIAGSSNAADR